MTERTWSHFLSWFARESLKIFTAPMSVYGGAVDALKGWKYSRNSTMFWIHLPAFLILLSVYLIYGFSVFERTDSKVQRYGVEGEKTLPTRTLESIANTKFSLLFPNVKPATPESAFPSERAKRAFQFAELLAKRILTFEPNSVPTRYRLALMKSIQGDEEQAKEIMFDIASGEYGTYPPASCWAASWILQAKEDNREVDMKDLGKHLNNATSWNECNVKLVSIFSILLEQNGLAPKAIEVAMDASKRDRRYNLQLAGLYSRLNNQEGLRQASYAAEEFFGAKLNTGNEQDDDRLAIAEVRKLTGRLPQAASVLEEGLMNNAKRPRLSRMLSDVRIAMFQQSIAPGPGGTMTADMTLLESAIDADPENPSISEQAARLLTQKIKPSKKIIDALRKQIANEITTAQSHSLLAQGYYLTGDEENAIKNWEMAIKKNVNARVEDANPYNNLAFCLFKSVPPNLERALQLIDIANKTAPKNAEVLDTYGQILMAANRPKEAISKFEQSIAADENRIATRKKLIDAYLAAGLKDMAKAQKEVVESMEPKPSVDEANKEPK
jgi:tetratricopeptide (TPR) repeat protein